MKYLNSTPSEVLKEVWGYDSFRENQEEAIQALLENNDVLFLAKTGLGKTLTFQLPSLMKEGTAIVVSPLLSLMEDQINNTEKIGITSKTLNSTLGKKAKTQVLNQLENNEVDLLYIAPESLLNQELLDFLIEKVKINYLIFDEAHCISQYGNDFRPKYKQVAVLREFFNVPCIALTATADSKTVEDIKKTLKFGNEKSKHNFVEFKQNLDRPSIHYNIIKKVGNGYRQAYNIINKYDKNVTGIIYCSTRKLVEDVARFLYTQGIKAKPYHSGLKTAEKELVLQNWLDNEVQVVVATIAFGMGIDHPDVRYVIHMNMPFTLEGYVQECVHPNTLITTINGDKKAKDIKENDRILTLNPHTFQNEFKDIAKIIVHDNSEDWVKVQLNNGTKIDTTNNHDYLIKDENESLIKIKANDLKVGQQLISLEGDVVITGIKKYNKLQQSYDFTIFDNSNFYMNGVLSSNCGRASRTGIKSDAYLLYNPEDVGLMKWMIKQTTNNPAHLNTKLEKLNDIVNFINTKKCYRISLLSYFNQEYPKDKCDSCSNCLKDKLN